MKFGIIGAMEEEVNQLKAHMEVANVSTRASMEFTEGALGNHDAVVVRSGIGKVNAAICAQILIDAFEVDAILNTGIAGGLHSDVNICDIVLSVDALQHDLDAVAFGYDLGVIPRMDESIFKADGNLLASAKKVCQRVNPDIGVHEGRVLSGDQFISDHDKKEWLIDTFSGMCTEMEGAAIAQTAHLNAIPFLIIRAISDKADGSASMDYAEFEKQAIAHTVRLVEGLLSELS